MSKDYQSGELKDGFVLSEEEFQESLRMAYGRHGGIIRRA
jgi:hypothetical protein